MDKSSFLGLCADTDQTVKDFVEAQEQLLKLYEDEINRLKIESDQWQKKFARVMDQNYKLKRILCGHYQGTLVGRSPEYYDSTEFFTPGSNEIN